jgi:hypothetical protein
MTGSSPSAARALAGGPQTVLLRTKQTLPNKHTPISSQFRRIINTSGADDNPIPQLHGKFEANGGSDKIRGKWVRSAWPGSLETV